MAMNEDELIEIEEQFKAMADAEDAFNVSCFVPDLTAEVRKLRKLKETLFDAIKHGDGEHQAWLEQAIEAHFDGKSVPPAKGMGKLQAENAKLRKVAEAAKSLNDNLEPEDISIDIESLVASLRQYLKETGYGDEPRPQNS